jgi:hypothetical protein
LQSVVDQPLPGNYEINKAAVDIMKVLERRGNGK